MILSTEPGITLSITGCSHKTNAAKDTQICSQLHRGPDRIPGHFLFNDKDAAHGSPALSRGSQARLADACCPCWSERLLSAASPTGTSLQPPPRQSRKTSHQTAEQCRTGQEHAGSQVCSEFPGKHKLRPWNLLGKLPLNYALLLFFWGQCAVSTPGAVPCRGSGDPVPCWGSNCPGQDARQVPSPLCLSRHVMWGRAVLGPSESTLE